MKTMRCLEYIKNIFSLRRYDPNGYWEHRAKVYGKQAVLNLSHAGQDYDRITNIQKQILYPILKDSLNGNETTVLDLGCGPGRFTSDLARMIGGSAVGVEPIAKLIECAPSDSCVRYIKGKAQQIPCDDNSFDIVWVCLVLGGITEEGDLVEAAKEIKRVIRDNGILLLAENTTDKPNGKYWHFRSPKFYKDMFGYAELEERGSYQDVGETISVLSGRVTKRLVEKR